MCRLGSSWRIRARTEAAGVELRGLPMAAVGVSHCSPNLCPPCSRAAVAVQIEPLSDWSHLIEAITDGKQRACVREYLAGIYKRGKVAERAKR